ncbi:MAG: DUF5652 family protein [Candidatus Pacearchaeota archaeon]|nr:DUF5652 family protein [Candidatus Pacearchaeota archaeon]
MVDYIALAVAQLGIPLSTIIVISIWEANWTAIAMWKSARNNHLVWFIVFLIVNLIGIPEIIYLIVTRKKKNKRKR